MSRVSAKICGITTLRDARLAAAAGADAVGFVFAAGSPRRVTPAAAARIIRRLPGGVIPVGVFVNASPARVAAIARQCRLERIQLHGDETPAECRAIRRVTRLPIVKAVRVVAAADVAAIRRYRGVADDVLLDTRLPSGKRKRYASESVPFSLARRAKRFGLPVILAGGLRPDTVARAIRQVRPAGVDVSSGVERSPGRKDPAKLRAFLRAAHGVRPLSPKRGLTPSGFLV